MITKETVILTMVKVTLKGVNFASKGIPVLFGVEDQPLILKYTDLA